MQFIALVGVDGSGKSTQANLLRERLEAQGKKVAYFHAVEFSLANRLARFFKKKAFEPGQEKAVAEASLGSVILREKFLFIDMIRFFCWKRHLRLENYDYIVSDRSFYDSLVNISYLSDSPLVRLGVRFLEMLLPQADHAIFFNLDTDTILSRERVPEQGKDYLEKKLTLFRTKIGPWRMTVINAARNPDDIFRDILRELA